MSGVFIDGKWHKEGFPTDSNGSFTRKPTSFRNQIEEAESGRYHLYISLACPWAHRTLIVRKLKGLEPHIGLSIVDYFMGEQGWFFSEREGATQDLLFGSERLGQVYLKADPKYTGRVTVPVLWDKDKQTIVNNESREIMRIFSTKFSSLVSDSIDLCPPALEANIDEWIDRNYESINNGVYKCGFATSQEAYDKAYQELFDALDVCESHLMKHRFLCGEQLTEADIALFTTLIRFDAVYYSHFKCNRQHVYEYPGLWRFVKELYHEFGLAETCNFHHIKHHYYESHPAINPTGIVPNGPKLPL